MKRIVITFNEKGETIIDSSGFSGDSCLKDTDELLDGFDKELKGRKLKDEIHTKTQVGTRVQT